MALKRINLLSLGLAPLVIMPIATIACTAATETLSLNDNSIEKYLGRIKILSRENIFNKFLEKNPDLQIIDKERELSMVRVEHNRAYIRIHNAFWNRSKYGRSRTVLYYDSYIWPLYDYEKITNLTAEKPKSTFGFAVTEDFILDKFRFGGDATSYLKIETTLNETKNILLVKVEIKEDKLKESQKTRLNFGINEENRIPVGLPGVDININ